MKVEVFTHEHGVSFIDGDAKGGVTSVLDLTHEQLTSVFKALVMVHGKYLPPDLKAQPGAGFGPCGISIVHERKHLRLSWDDFGAIILGAAGALTTINEMFADTGSGANAGN